MDLSSDLILEILKFIDNTSHLASACLVNRIFHRYASPLLYKHITIYSWMKDAKKRVVTLFSTLSRRPNLAFFVHSLGKRTYQLWLRHCHVFLIEICDCPKFFSESFLSEVLKGLQLCINLRRCAWTRDGTITSQILESLSSCQNLREIELNGRSDRRYDPHLLLRFKNLDKVSIIMPSSGVVNCLKDWVLLNQYSWRSLSLVCQVRIFFIFIQTVGLMIAKESTLITDDVLEPLAPSLPNLEHLHMSGCPRLTNRSVWALLLSNSEGLVSLGLEGLALVNHLLFIHTFTHTTCTVYFWPIYCDRGAHWRKRTASPPPSSLYNTLCSSLNIPSRWFPTHELGPQIPSCCYYIPPFPFSSWKVSYLPHIIVCRRRTWVFPCIRAPLG